MIADTQKRQSYIYVLNIQKYLCAKIFFLAVLMRKHHLPLSITNSLSKVTGAKKESTLLTETISMLVIKASGQG